MIEPIEIYSGTPKLSYGSPFLSRILETVHPFADYRLQILVTDPDDILDKIHQGCNINYKGNDGLKYSFPISYGAVVDETENAWVMEICVTLCNSLDDYLI